jgi:ATP-binding cassette subfamily B protein
MLQRLSPLFPYLRRYWRSYVWGGLSLLVYNACKSLIALVIGHSIDDMRLSLSAAKIEHYAFLLLGIAAVSSVFLYLMRQILIGASREIEFDIRNDLFQGLEAQQPSFFQHHRVGDIMARSTNDLNAVRQ